MWGGEGGARPKLCYFDRHLNYLIPSLLDNHQNFQDCWWQLSISCNEKENMEGMNTQDFCYLPFTGFGFQDSHQQMPISDSCTVCSYPDALF